MSTFWAVLLALFVGYSAGLTTAAAVAYATIQRSSWY